MISLTRIIPFLCKNKCLFFLCMLFALIDGFSMPAIGVLLAQLLYFLLQYSTNPDYYFGKIQIIWWITLGVALSASLSNALAIWFGQLLGQDIIRKVRLSLYEKLLKFPMEWFNRTQNQSEKVVSNMTVNSKILHSFLSL